MRGLPLLQIVRGCVQCIPSRKILVRDTYSETRFRDASPDDANRWVQGYVQEINDVSSVLVLQDSPNGQYKIEQKPDRPIRYGYEADGVRAVGQVLVNVLLTCERKKVQ